MAEKLDPQVQIRVINLAEEWSSAMMPRDWSNAETWFKNRSESFDKAYKAILKTLAE